MDDILRVLSEMHTFTSDDVAEALDMTRSGANARLLDMLEGKWLIRVKSGHNYLYGLSDKSLRRLAGLPAIDPNERALLLEMCQHDETYTHSWIAPGDITMTQYICRECGEITRWTKAQNAYRG